MLESSRENLSAAEIRQVLNLFEQEIRVAGTEETRDACHRRFLEHYPSLKIQFAELLSQFLRELSAPNLARAVRQTVLQQVRDSTQAVIEVDDDE